MKKNYYERKQLKHRAQYGKLEKRSELITRLKKIKEKKKKVQEAEEEANLVTGKEYFFKYHSLSNKDGKLCAIEKDTKEELEKKRLFVDKEITRIEIKLKNFIDVKNNKKIVFDEDDNPVEIEYESLFKSNENIEKYKKYYSELIKAKQEICNLK